jgi:hypothetical protein
VTTSRRAERGAAESLQLVLIWPVVLMATVAVIQAGLWLHGRNAAIRAANVAVDEARGAAGSPDRARARALDAATHAGLSEVKVRVLRIEGRAEAQVTGQAQSLIGFGIGRVEERATAPLERVPGQ